jgi:hypothetical protein
MLSAEGKGVRLGGTDLFRKVSDETAKSLQTMLGLTDPGLKAALNGAAETSANAYTLGRPEYLLQGSIPTILLSSRALKSKTHLAYTLAHELIHANGWRARPLGWWERVKARRNDENFYAGNTNHDLSHVPGYDDILRRCAGGVK